MFVVAENRYLKPKQVVSGAEASESRSTALSGNKVEDFKHEEMKSWNMSEVYR